MKSMWQGAAMAACFGVLAVAGCNAVSGRDTPVNAGQAATADAGTECISALGCAEGQICTEGVCTQTSACNNAGSGVGCPSGQVCDDNICKPVDAIAPPSCRVNSDCPSGLDCAQGQCQSRSTTALTLPAPPPGISCVSESDCPPVLTCVNGHCASLPHCEADENCDKGSRCVGGLCSRQAPEHCEFDTDCFAGQSCVDKQCQ
ncbi:MAG: hypothetical protein ACJ790_19455 [Myxococcaceae bacterium]